MAPEGMMFAGVRSALEHVIKNKYPEPDIAMLRSAMHHNHWKMEDSLPMNWFYKTKSRATIFVDSDGKVYESVEKALNNIPNESEAQRFLNYFRKDRKIKSKVQETSRKISNNWKIDESLYPNGWKYMEIKRVLWGQTVTHHRLVTPDGVRLGGVRAALEHMIKNNYPETDLEIMKSAMIQNNWNTDMLLPPNWFYKKNSHHGLKLVDNKGNLYKNKEHALKNVASERDVFQLREFLDNQKENSYTEFQDGSSLRTHSRTKIVEKDWLASSLYPTGWLFKPGKKDPKRIMLLSPNAIIHNGVRKALGYMIQNRFPQDEISIMRRAMGQRGWIEHEALPENWMYKIYGRHIQFCDAKASYYNSKDIALKSDNDELDLAKIKCFRSIVQPRDVVQIREFLNNQKEKSFTELSVKQKKFQDDLSLRTNSRTKIVKKDWLASSLYPTGWMFKPGKKDPKWVTLLSPNGTSHNGVRKALGYMIQNKFPQDEISIMRKAMGQRGWIEHEALPENWLYRKDGRAIKFCDANRVTISAS